MTAWVVAGPAGSGKSTLGRALARRTGAALLDLDTVTNPLLDALAPALRLLPHWNSDEHRDVVRPARYAALRAVAGEQVQLGLDVVLAAPFTAELTGGAEWQQLVAVLDPAEARVIWLRASPQLLAERVAGRGEERDAVVGSTTTIDPAVPHLTVDAALPTSAQLDLVLGR